ncbi:GNAT family N-acetyltransferase [Saccharibacillus sacchari]|uniref:GNAT family N-acetyltransferase n=1 Tax=Saccharibacillus sacchari TaxID=456493 RepID=UPI0004B32094|nr:GNAT family N-acetyltransferase [Saccharibacillus sacchari]
MSQNQDTWKDAELRWAWEIPSAFDLHELYEALEWNDFLRLEPKQLRLAVEGSWKVISAYADERLIATGRLVSDGVINAYLCGVGVRSELRGQGIHIQLFCSEEHRAYYRGLGFEEFAFGFKKDGRF